MSTSAEGGPGSITLSALVLAANQTQVTNSQRLAVVMTNLQK